MDSAPIFKCSEQIPSGSAALPDFSISDLRMDCKRSFELNMNPVFVVLQYALMLFRDSVAHSMHLSSQSRLCIGVPRYSIKDNHALHPSSGYVVRLLLKYIAELPEFICLLANG